MADVIYLSHGGGPLPILGDVSHQSMVHFLESLPESISKPSAIVVISAHWEEEKPTIIGSENPTLLYDYFGFPDEAYTLKYPIKGDLRVVKKIEEIFRRKNCELLVDNCRGVDHGLFIPMKIMYPEADIPIIQLSLIKGLDPKKHIELGQLLSGLKSKNVLIIGSGFSFHNMAEFTFSNGNSSDHKNDEFQDWLIDVCTNDYPVQIRENKLINWSHAPHSRYCHPREEHL